MHAIEKLVDVVKNLCSEQQELNRLSEERFRFLAARLEADAGWHRRGAIVRVSRPVFVMGCVRSGTTAIGKALKAASLPGWTEGHLFPLLHFMKQKIDQYFVAESPYLANGWGVSFLAPGDLESLLVDYFEQLQLSHHLSTRWVDKTPGAEMIEAAPYLHSLWPHARFIFCRRRGVENIKSQLRRFANESGVNIGFQDACVVWARCMEKWAGVRESLGETFCEIDQGEMAKNPEGTAAKLAGLLDLTSSQAEALRNSLRDCHPELTSSSFAPESLEETGWSKDQRNFFLTMCGPSMQSYGYPIGGDADAKMQAAIFLPFCNEPEKVSLANLENPADYIGAEHGAFMLHPNMPSEPPPVVTFRSLSLHGHSRFFAGLELRHPQAEPVIFRIRLQESDRESVLAEGHCIVRHGKVESWHLDFPPVSGPVDVSLSTEMAPDSPHNLYAWAHWISPRFLIQ